MTIELLIFGGIVWVLPMYIGYQQGLAKNRYGFWWGFCLGWLGVICLAFLPPSTQTRPVD